MEQLRRDVEWRD
jgi:hypothetical protein